MSEILTASGIHKSYKMGQTQLNVLKGLDLSIDSGQFTAIIGASGSGKSTLLHILGALDRPDKGAVLYKGKALETFSSRQLNQFRNRTVGFVFQFYHLLDELNIVENVVLPAMVSMGSLAWLARRKSIKSRAKELLASLGLEDRFKHKPYQLSGGERQRAAIARALINKPELLLADEPTGNLDSATGNGILEVFEKLNAAGQTIVIVTHDNRIAEKAHKIIHLAGGRVIAG